MEKTLYQRAADILERFGWCQDHLQIADGSMCIIGAMNYAHHGTHRYENGSDSKVENWSRDLGFIDCEDMIEWNNYPFRIKTEVIARLRA